MGNRMRNLSHFGSLARQVVGNTKEKGMFVTTDHDQIRTTIDLTYRIDELRVHGNTAMARTTSNGTITIHDGGNAMESKGRELFVLAKDGGWKIGAFMFNQPAEV